MTRATEAILEARGVIKQYSSRGRASLPDAALDGVSVLVRSGETLGVVGESGSGKTTLMRLLLGIERPTGGSILFMGSPLVDQDKAARRHFRRSVATVFQNPYSSLDPTMRIWQVVTEQLSVERQSTPPQRRQRAVELLAKVGLDPNVADGFPRQLSGGQRQRVAIARSIVSNPKIIILDEAISALDVSIRAQIVNLLLDLQEQLNLTYVFVAHDLAVVRHLCHRVIVMYKGRIVEEGPTSAIFASPSHPYTAALIEASYLADANLNQPSEPADAPTTGRVTGCSYQSRCPLATELCKTMPPYADLGAGHRALCHYPLLANETAQQATATARTTRALS